jgi:ssDNA thymidine ADP-ribosyltransferase DarT-like protein
MQDKDRGVVDQFIDFLTSREINTPLYHFTDQRNLASIREHGLISKAWARQNGIKIPRYSGDEIGHLADWNKGLEDFVPLSFSSEHPMEHAARMAGRIEKSAFLQIKPAILREEGVKMTLDIANKPDVPLLDPGEALAQVDFDVLYAKRDRRDPAIQERLLAARRCTILVPSRVPLTMIIGGL